MDDSELIDVRNEALRKIGRNVVDFQKMERVLKTLVIQSNMQGFVSEFKETHRKRIKNVDRRPMGWLVKDFMDSVYSQSPSGAKAPDDLNQAWMSFSFKIDADNNDVRARKKALLLVAAERNALIHKMLSTFDASSLQSCRDLILLLDKQHERLAPHYESVMRTLGNLKRVQKEFLKQLESALISLGNGNGDAP